MAGRAAQATWADLALALPKAKRSGLDHNPFPFQLAKLSTSPPAGKGWLHEIKWDGYRLAVTVVGGKVRLWSRNGGLDRPGAQPGPGDRAAGAG